MSKAEARATGSTGEGSGARRFWTRGTIAFFAALGLLVVLLLLFAMWLHLNASARREFEREIAKIRAKGEPVTPDELAPPPVPDEENAAVVFQDAFAEAEAARAEAAGDAALTDWDIWGFDEIGENREKVEKVLWLHAKALRLAREAIARPKCRFDVDYARGFEMEQRHLAGLRGMARLLRAEVRLRAHAGRADDAAQSLLDVLRLARALDGEPILMSKLVQVAVLRMGIGALGDVVRAAPLCDDVAGEIIAELGRYDCRASGRQAMTAERALGADMAARIAAGEIASSGSSRPAGTTTRILEAVFAHRFLIDGASFLGAQTEIVEAARLPPWQALARVNSVLGRTSALSPMQMPMTGALLGSVGRAYAALVGCQARCDAARLGLACGLYRSKHGRYPTRLQELAPEFLPDVPPDPFTGKPFVYKYKRNSEGSTGGFVVYSVGHDLVDDGGVFDTRGFYGPDIGWEANVPRLAR